MVDCDKLRIHVIISRAVIKKIKQSGILKAKRRDKVES